MKNRHFSWMDYLLLIYGYFMHEKYHCHPFLMFVQMILRCKIFWFAMSLHEFSSFHHVCLWYLCRDLYHTFIIKGRCLLWFMKYLYVNYFQIPEQLDKTHSLMLFSWYQAQNVDNNTVLKCCHLCFVILTLIIFNEILH